MPPARNLACTHHPQTRQRRQQLSQDFLPASVASGLASPEPRTQPARALSPATARIYAGAWTAFQVWCRAQDAVALPATPHTVAAYLEACATRLGPSGLRRVLAALAQRHPFAGQPSPAGDPLVAYALADMKARAPRLTQAAAFAASELRQLLETYEEPANNLASGYHCHALIKADISRFKRVIGKGLRSRTGRPEYIRLAY